MIEFSVPILPPSLWKAYRQTRYGGKFLSKEGKAFKFAVFLKVKNLGYKFVDDKMSYSLNLEFHCKNWLNKDGSVKKRDISNLVKIAEDALVEAIKVDDSRFWKLTVEKKHSEKEMTLFRLE